MPFGFNNLTRKRHTLGQSRPHLQAAADYFIGRVISCTVGETLDQYRGFWKCSLPLPAFRGDALGLLCMGVKTRLALSVVVVVVVDQLSF